MQSTGQKAEGKLGFLTGYLVCRFLDTGTLDESVSTLCETLIADGTEADDSLCISAIHTVREVLAKRATTTGIRT